MIYNRIGTAILLITILCLNAITLSAQVVIGNTQPNGSKSNNIIVAVPFLLITPDARTGAMGNAGVATPGDLNATSINPAKLAYLSDSAAIGISYSPWLKNLIPDVALAYLSGYYQLGNRNTIGGSVRYFSLGEVQLTDINQQPLGIANPNELAVDFSYARSYGPNFSLGSTIRFISSNLSSGLSNSGQAAGAGTSIAADVGALFKKPTMLFQRAAVLSAGISISNIGTKIRYADGDKKYFLPTNLKIGGAADVKIDDNNQFIFALDFNKLLVPTQPRYDLNGNIVAGRDPDRSVPSGIFGSFSDAPGGFSEEMQEISISTGMEYWYAKKFALRMGYNYENPYKGDNNYLTLGLGLKYNLFNIDFSYLVANVHKNPLANTLRFSLLFNLSSRKQRP